MAFFKKNLLFCVVVLICVLAFLAGVYLAFAESGNVKKAERKLSNSESQLNGLLYADPAPTAENVAAAEENLAQLTAALASIREDLQRGSRLSTSEDGVSVMASVQQYISEFQKKAAAHSDEQGEPTPITIPDDFAFGFEQYIDEAPMLDDGAKVSVLDKQRQILSYAVTQLMNSNPQSIDVVEREILELGGDAGFIIDEAISARVPGAIETIAFRVQFDGYTSSLRSFLNNLAKFDLPIVVRSIAVERPSGSETVVSSNTGNNLSDIFGAFGGDTTTKESVSEAQKPVIEENVSTFTVIIEFIEVVLPDETNQVIS